MFLKFLNMRIKKTKTVFLSLQKLNILGVLLSETVFQDGIPNTIFINFILFKFEIGRVSEDEIKRC